MREAASAGLVAEGLPEAALVALAVAGADLVCDSPTDVAVPAKAFAGAFDVVALSTGRFDANAGRAPDGSRRLRIAAGVTVRGAGPDLTRLVAEAEPCRVIADAPGANVATVLGNAALASAIGGTAAHATNSDSFSATLRCHDANGEVYTLGLSRSRVTLSSYEDDAIRPAVETWADSVPAQA